MREVQLDRQLGEGLIHWSASTAVDLIAKQATGATVLTTDYLTRQLRTLEAGAVTRVEDGCGTNAHPSSVPTPRLCR